MERCSSKQAGKGLKGWSTGITNLEVIGAGFCSGGNTLTPETKKMGSPSDRVLRTEVLLPIETRYDLKSLQCSPRKEESGQNGTGSVTNNMRLKKSCCHQSVRWSERNKMREVWQRRRKLSPPPLIPKESQCSRLRETDRGNIQPSLPV